VSGDRITIVIQLPAPLDAVSEVLRVIGDRWPTASIDTSHEDGWHIELPRLA
jgi:hypothetical protein